MLTKEQVQRHSDVAIDIYSPSFSDSLKATARLLYSHNDKLHRLYMKFEATRFTLYEGEVRQMIDWDRFTEWVNNHDDLTEDNLLTREQWIELHRSHPAMRGGREGAFDTVENRLIDYHKIVLV